MDENKYVKYINILFYKKNNTQTDKNNKRDSMVPNFTKIHSLRLFPVLVFFFLLLLFYKIFKKYLVLIIFNI